MRRRFVFTAWISDSRFLFFRFSTDVGSSVFFCVVEIVVVVVVVIVAIVVVAVVVVAVVVVVVAVVLVVVFVVFVVVVVVVALVVVTVVVLVVVVVVFATELFLPPGRKSCQSTPFFGSAFWRSMAADVPVGSQANIRNERTTLDFIIQHMVG